MLVSKAAKIVYEVVKAFYTGTGYSGVHDPDFDAPPDTSFFNRTNYEKVVRQKKFFIDGNLVRVATPWDLAGDPVTKLDDVMLFNSQDSMQKWIQSINARLVGPKQYEISLEQLGDDKTWMR